MSKELAFTDDNDVVKYLDTTTSLNLALTADGLAFDLTNAKTIVIKIANDDGYIMDKSIDLTKITNLLNGTIIFLIDQEVMTTLVPDDYDIEVWVTMNDGTQAIFPSDGTLGFSIEENLMSDTGEVIPTITLNDFKQQFDDLSSQMENAVHNVQKGDQGNPGNGIKAANNQYQLSDSPVTVPTGNWSDTILATTDQLPYLWTKIIFTYDDGTTKEINFVSSRGDTGSQGPIGPVGPQGKQGNGLVVRGKADKEGNLPTIGNNQGDGYLVGTNLYIWIDGSWQNMGSITPDLADYVKVTDMNNALNTKVNVTDMRKPASDVAGIEEVNAKQDKIGYTPADDSKVVHTTDTSNWQKQKVTADNGQPGIYVNNGKKISDSLIAINQAGFWSFYANSGASDNPWSDSIKGFTMCDSTDGHWSATVGTLEASGNYVSIVNDNGTIRFNKGSDDSKVAHLSGANNFDTVPTVNNNPLLLASSLPADLARTSQLANFTAGLQSGGVSVATSDDLKSVEKSAWRQLDLSNISTTVGGDSVSSNSNFIYKIDTTNNRIYFNFIIFSNSMNTQAFEVNFSKIAHQISIPTLPNFKMKARSTSIDSYDIRINSGNLEIYGSPVTTGGFAEYTNSNNSTWYYTYPFITYDTLV
ncbi:hypothetical protein FIU74_08275 [Lactobacillus buchneri]|uniref:hypothetical protein n=1 Tax=Lentilactobacillus buchneri TaxID=1581 RepID=UPI0011ECFF5C|nr:hypothetical protein [Lentilactobacillus buchneri]MQM82919.1 hypothetical protein [Lentilactobacillus buchneri]